MTKEERKEEYLKLYKLAIKTREESGPYAKDRAKTIIDYANSEYTDVIDNSSTFEGKESGFRK